ncbi:hypothetical protein GH714_016423 [Hevea brasiliensis]|uniref:Disease resistance N-terminal domain-containing protein n=1 Tax=Hevea brasiliensis TaxID=3981 RepID=A0A6A6N4J4_HEVBR|nr:hypothetical protein GH714_016423 [Hevea brasiliensis]
MAEAVLCDLAGIISKLASLVLQETILCFGVKDDLGKLGRTVSTIQAVLLDAEQQYSQSHQVKEWVDSLKDAFYDADDLLDEFSTDVLVKQMMTGNKMVKEVRLFFSSSNPFVYGLKMAHKIGKVRSKLDEIVANRNFHLENLSEKTFPMVEKESKLTLLYLNKKSLEDILKMKISVSQSTSSSISLSPLKILYIEGIEDLEVLPEDLWHLTSLEDLVIKACEELNLSDDVQWQYLRSLQRLQFANLIKLASLPKGLQHVPTLRRLVIKVVLI